MTASALLVDKARRQTEEFQLPLLPPRHTLLT